jgi:hypothetical protein
VSINVNDKMMFDRWNIFSQEIDNEVRMVADMTGLCSDLENGKKKDNEDDYMQNNDVDNDDRPLNTGNERTPPYAKQRSFPNPPARQPPSKTNSRPEASPKRGYGAP